ncbi:SDR family oxidoreductase [uncultured Sphingomonas sp.]|uniref:SDR family oxidoreductase n=1 Tax=uncultured Sphingomonas sp. TaxID=158754 RepID=UPI0035CC9BEF
MPQPRILVTGATGQLGALVIDALLKTVPAADIAGLVRTPSKAEGLESREVQTRTGDYTDPASLRTAFEGIEKLLFVSSGDLDGRAQQHRNVVTAAAQAGVTLIAYTSILHADRSPLMLAEDHRQTEALLAASGVPTVLLRNGWYTENYLASLPAALAHDAVLGAACDGRIASAARADYADAAAAVLTSPHDQGGRTYELAGDAAYTLAELAAELSRQVGRPIAYHDLPQAEFEKMLLGAGLPPFLAALLADSDAGAAKGGLFDDSGELGRLIGRPTTPLATSMAAVLKAG